MSFCNMRRRKNGNSSTITFKVDLAFLRSSEVTSSGTDSNVRINVNALHPHAMMMGSVENGNGGQKFVLNL